MSIDHAWYDKTLLTEAKAIENLTKKLDYAALDRIVERLLEEEHVAAVPGSAFGPSGAGHVRMCYATSYEQLEEALERIGRFVGRRREAATAVGDA